MTWEELRDILNTRLAGKTPDDVSDYVNNQITDLASAKEHIRELTLIVLFILNNTGFRLGD